MTLSDPTYVPERRPIPARNHPLSIRAADWLARQGATPNAISVAGMACGTMAGIAFALTPHVAFAWVLLVAAAVLIQLRLLANMFDGMVAVQTGKTSRLGELFNEVPDRISDCAILVGAGYAVGGLPELGFLAALAAMFTAYVRAEGKVAGAHQEYCGPMAKQQRMFVLMAAALYVAFAPETWQPRWSRFPDLGVMAAVLIVVAVGGFFTTIRRLRRIGQALVKDQS